MLPQPNPSAPTPPEPVAFAGCGVVTALGAGTEPLQRALDANTGGLTARPQLACRGYQSVVAGFVPEAFFDSARAAHPAHADARAFLLAAEAIQQAERHAGAWLGTVPPERRGLVLATTKADIEALENLLAGRPCSPAARRHVQPARLAADLAAGARVRGPVQCVSVACVSGLLAIQQGARLIQRGQADLVYVAGVDLVSHFVLAGFSTLKSLEPDGCRPFDRARAGLTLGEGAGAVVLARPGLCGGAGVFLSGWGSSNDANHLTGPSRDGSGLALAITRALAAAAAAPESIDYIHVHGTGTPYNDAMESLAIRAVFGRRVPPFSSTKGILGHTLGAAGVIETIVCLLAFQARRLPGTPRLRERDPSVPDALLAAPQPAPALRRVLKINCGFAGTNAALLLEHP